MKKIKFITSMSVLVMGVSLVSPQVLAASADSTTGKGNIEYTEDEEKEIIVDPEDPEVPVIPDDKGETNDEKGALRVDFVSHLNFGKQGLTNTKKSYYAEEIKDLGVVGATTKVNRGNWVQVTDKRAIEAGKSSKGWTLYSEITKQFTSEKDTTKVLNGAVLDYANPFVNGENYTDGDIKTPANTVKFGAGKAKMAEAAAGKGWGKYTIEYGRPAGVNGLTEDTKTSNKSVQLTVPANQIVKDQYKAEITWTLAEEPQP